MRLSIVIVFLIGAMVVTEVMCDVDQEVLKVLALLEKTIKRLESGQTVTQNHEFIYLAIDGTDELLKLVSYPKLVNRKGISPNIPKRAVDGILVPCIEEIGKVVRSDTKPTVHVKYVLEAIAYVLRGKLGSAKSTIELSKKHLPDSVSCSSASSASSSSEELGSDLEIPPYQVVRRPVGYIGSLPPLPDTDSWEGHPHNRYPFYRQYPEGESSNNRNPFSRKSTEGGSGVNSSTRISDYSVGQIGMIREWLLSMMVLRVTSNPNNEWILKMRTCVPEIAHALIYSLPDEYLPSEESKFIGRYPVEEKEVIGNRIETIVQHITEMTKDGGGLGIAEVLIVRDVLEAIRQILIERWKDALVVIYKSTRTNGIYQDNSRQPFNNYMTGTYGLTIPVDEPNV
jgi:hypothetical protein